MPQQRRAQATRRTILVAAAEEFDRVGYEATTLNGILRRGGVTKGAFYFHFASKEDVARVLVREQRERWPALWRRWVRQGLDPLSTAIGLVDELLAALDEDVATRAGMRLACRREVDAATPPDWEQVLAELLGRAADSGYLLPAVDPRALARVVYAALVGARTIDRGAASTGRTAEVWRVVLRGAATPEWLRTNPMLQPPDERPR
ncbi:TetR/AcrR family transcriptional regulator [Saccharopolyspora erythraea]|uniref:ScbR family autoregulator-binding transcription factor n=1 Tax=Saccharopolyspora erythraea TaxID=1836 RepID=UPI001BAABF5B|nr:ScbR family autoregulator-binding transcription factor [Saccharopolyspora erythraea]QUH05344.1 TetR/AcrR family transcriptional regulator [Saccharopolyspora erythraea]